MNQFDRLERLAQRLIEKPFQYFFRKKLHPADLTDYLETVVESKRRNGHGADVIPGCYQIVVSPVDYDALVASSGREAIVAELYHYLNALAEEADYQFDEPLQVLLEQDETVPPGQIEVKTNVALRVS